MNTIITNAFSLNMLSNRNNLVDITKVDIARVRLLLSTTEFTSAVGHETTAVMFEQAIGLPVAFNRTSVEFIPGVTLVIGQYKGPRLEEGAKELPAGATIEWYLVEFAADKFSMGVELWDIIKFHEGVKL